MEAAILPLSSTEIPAPGPDRPADESLLLSRFRESDAAAFEALYRHHNGRIYGYVMRLTGAVESAEELTQEVFVRAWQHRADFQNPSHFRSWLFRVASNLWIGQLRSARRRTTEALEPEEEARLEAPSAAPPALGLELERAIRRLPERIRAVLVLFDVYGFRHAEIAELLDITVSTSKIHLHRARRRLKEVLQ